MRQINLQPGPRPGVILATFAYDPELINIVKQVPGREWNKLYRAWQLPDTPENLAWLKARLPANVKLAVAPALEQAIASRATNIAAAHAVRRAGDSDIEFTYLTQPYAHQRAGLEFLTKIGSGALLWEMGLGKTKTAIDFATYLALRGNSDFRVLVICPNTVKRNWAMEIEKHAGHDDWVIPTGTLKQRASQVGTARYTIVNAEALSFEAMWASLHRTWDLVIVDESTRFKNAKAMRTKRLLKIEARHRVILTGTPITNTAEDAWAPFTFVQPGLLGSWWSFVDNYMTKDYFGNVTGVKPHMQNALAERIESRSYRILKREVLDLPEKVYVDRAVELEGRQLAAYQSMRDDLRMSLEGKQVEAFNILTQLLRLTQVTAGLIGTGDDYAWLDDNAKVTELDAMMEELAGEQVVIFGLYQKELEALAARYTKPLERIPGETHMMLPIIYGPTPEQRRAELIAQFQAGQRRLLFCQSRTGGIGINLTAAQTAVYYTRGWSLEDYLQSQDRLHRIGQTGTVSIIHLVARGTVDDQIAKALASKQSLADQLTGDAARTLAREVLGEA